MNETFCKDLYDEILKTYQDSSKYRIKEKSETQSYIDYIPKGLNDFIKSISAFSSISSYVQIILEEPIFRINIKLCRKETGEEYLVIWNYCKIKSVWINMSKKSWHPKYDNAYLKKLLIFSRNDVYAVSLNGKFYPSSFKDLKKFPAELASMLSRYFTETSIWKDFLADNFYPPVKINELSKYYNKKDYLEKIFNLSLPKSINKLSLNQTYAACCALKYIKPEQTYFLFSSGFAFNQEYNISKHEQKFIASEYLKFFISARTADNDNCIKDIICDYVDFSLQQRKMIDVLAGKKKIMKLHDELSEEIMRKANRCLKSKIPESPLKYLKLPKEFILLNTQKSLSMEGKINHNCVGGYGEKIIKGKCVIYSANINQEHLTIEIRFRKAKNGYKFYVNQCYKAYNQPCSPSTLEYVKECLEGSSEKAIEKFLDLKN